MRLSPAKKNIRSFLKRRISFHGKGFDAAKRAMKEAIDLRKAGAANADAERSKCLRDAAAGHRKLANWHLRMVAKLYKKKGKLFPTNGK